MKIGYTVFSAKNGPFLNLIIPLLLEVPPSGKTKSLAYFLFDSTRVCLSTSVSIAFYLSSSDLPLGMNTQLMQLRIVPTTGIFFKPAVGAKDGLK